MLSSTANAGPVVGNSLAHSYVMTDVTILACVFGLVDVIIHKEQGAMREDARLVPFTLGLSKSSPP